MEKANVGLGNLGRIVNLKMSDSHLIEEWYRKINGVRAFHPVKIIEDITDIKECVNNLYRQFLVEFFPTETFVSQFEKLKGHLLVLSLASVDLNFIRKIKKVTMAEIRYDSSEPFCAIETVDGETYYFSYSPAQNTEYCLCSPEDEGYHQEYDCVGIHCDWHIPVITKVHPDGKIIEFMYQGLQKDLW